MTDYGEFPEDIQLGACGGCWRVDQEVEGISLADSMLETKRAMALDESPNLGREDPELAASVRRQDASHMDQFDVTKELHRSRLRELLDGCGGPLTFSGDNGMYSVELRMCVSPSLMDSGPDQRIKETWKPVE